MEQIYLNGQYEKRVKLDSQKFEIKGMFSKWRLEREVLKQGNFEKVGKKSEE